MTFEIDNIELYFSKKQILRGIYLKAETGKITGILGHNGCGKSSLLKIFFGKLNPRHKLVRINNQAYLKPLFTSGMVKYLPQHNFIPPTLKVSQAFKLFGVDWKGFIQEFPECKRLLDMKIKNLSGGERRLTEIWLCLKNPSPLILLDEPFSHLSPVYIERIKEALTKEKIKKAILITDHMFRQIIEVSDDLYLLKNGCTHLINNINELEDYKYLNSGTF